MRLAIVGSRHFTDYLKIMATANFFFDLTTNIEIVSGGASGVDSLAKQLAKDLKLKYTEFLPKQGKTFAQKCYNRNREIVDYADIILAFWDGRISHCGTLLTMQLAIQKKKTMYAIGV